MDDMTKKLSGLVRRPNGYWYYRARVPKDLLRFYPEREKWISLGTKDELEARPKFHIIAAEKLREYAEVRLKYAAFSSQKQITPALAGTFALDREEAITLAKSYLAERLNDPESRRTARQWGKDAVHDIRAELSSDLWQLSQADSGDDGQLLVNHSAKNILRRGGYVVASDQKISGDFLDIVRDTLIALRKIELARLDGNFSDDPNNAELADFGSITIPFSEKSKVQKLTVQDAIDKLWREQIEPEPKAQKTVEKYKAAFRLLARFLGETTPLHSVSREKLVDYRDILRRMPSNYSKKFTANMMFGDIIAKADEVGAPRMQYKTRDAYLAMMRRLFSWAAVNDFLHKDISADIPTGDKPPKGKRSRRPFKVEELNTIFSAPVFTGCLDDGRNFAVPGPNKPRRSRYWLPLIALYTGMRMGEILQLRVGHVRVSDKGNPFFYLTDGFGEDDGDIDFIRMELKTYNSRREVPIHPILVAAGFLQFVEGVRAREGDELFPEVPKAADGKKSTTFSKRFARFLKKAGVKPDGNGNCFHMFRHTLRDVIRHCGISEEVADAVQGWGREQDIGRTYGLGFEVDAIAENWAKLQYSGFNYEHLLQPPSHPA